MPILAVFAAFTGVVAIIGWFFRKQERSGSFDAGPSTAAQPGLKTLFDFGERGWSRDGINQRPSRH